MLNPGRARVMFLLKGMHLLLPLPAFLLPVVAFLPEFVALFFEIMDFLLPVVAFSVFLLEMVKLFG